MEVAGTGSGVMLGAEVGMGGSKPVPGAGRLEECWQPQRQTPRVEPDFAGAS